MRFGSILLVIEGADGQRSLYRGGRAYWSAAIAGVLEKLGILGFEEAPPEVLADAARLGRFSAVLVARLLPASWTPAMLETLVAADRPVFLEGPFPDFVNDALGVSRRAEERIVEGTIALADETLAHAAAAYGMGTELAVRGSVGVKFVRKPNDMQWQLSDCPIDKRQAAVWCQVPWVFQSWMLVHGARNTQVLATLTDHKNLVWPCIVRRGRITAASFELFALLAYQLTAEPHEVNGYRNGLEVSAFEALLLAIIDALMGEADCVRVRLLPWPDGTAKVLGVRHDYDRAIGDDEIGKVAAIHRRHRIKSTWYLRHRHAANASLRKIARNPDTELALHTERVWCGGDGELETVRRATGAPITGMSAHGGHESFRFQGAPNFLWAEKHGLAYSDIPNRSGFFPFFFWALASDGTVRRTPVVALPINVSCDLGPTQFIADDRLAAESRKHAAAGGYMQIMNHPDLNNDAFDAALGFLTAQGWTTMTAGEVAQWWRATHHRERFALEPSADGERMRIAAADPSVVPHARFELRFPNGGPVTTAAVAAENGFDIAMPEPPPVTERKPATQSVAAAPKRRGERGAPAPLVDPGRKLIVFWMHRCGSTAGQVWFFRVAGWGARLKGKSASQISPLWFEEHADAYRDIERHYRDPDYLKLAIVRDPAERIVSAYSVAMGARNGSVWAMLDKLIPGLDPAERLSFNEFLEFLGTQDVYAANWHWRGQTGSDWYTLKLKDVVFARVETLNDNLDRICLRLGIEPVALKRSSAVSKVEAVPEGLDVPNMRLRRFEAAFGRDDKGLLRMPPYRHFITAETAPRIARIYARDFEALGYPYPEPYND